MKKRVRWTDYPFEEFTELRIHGAGATPLEDLLDSPSHIEVAGDEIAGFYRVPAEELPEYSKADPRRTLHYTDSGKQRSIEAYSWGRFSHGGGWRALWVLLLPYTFVNLAGWMVPRNGKRRRGLVRLLALLISVAVIYWLVTITTAVIKECGPRSLCASQSWLLSFADWDIFKAQAARLAILSLGLGTLATALLWWAGTRSADQYERYRDKTGTESANEAPPISNRNTQHKAAESSAPHLVEDAHALWHGHIYTKALAGAHVLAMLSALSAGVAVSTGRINDVVVRIGGYSPVLAAPEEAFAVGLLFVSLLVLVLVAAAVSFIDPVRSRPGRDAWLIRFLASGRVWLIGSALVLAAGVWILAHGSGPVVGGEGARFPDPMGEFHFYFANVGYSILLPLILVLLGALLLSGLARKNGADLGLTRRQRLGTRIRPFLSTITGVVVVAAMLVGGLLWTAQLLGRLATEEESPWIAQGLVAAELRLRSASSDVQWGEEVEEIAQEWRSETANRMAELGLGPLATRLQRLQAPLNTAALRLLEVASIDPETPDDALSDDQVRYRSLIENWSRDTEDLLTELSFGEQTISLSYVYFIMPLAFLVVTVLLLLGVALLWFVALWRLPGGPRPRYNGLISTNDIDPSLVSAIKAAKTEGNGVASTAETEAWERRVGTDLRKPFRNRRLPLLLLAPGVVFIFLIVWFFSETTISALAESLDRFLNVSIWLTVGIFLSTGFAIRSYYSGGGARGALGGIWDILTYWPRFYHPFSPPSYTVRAVPELNARITWLIENGGSRASGKVLASAHSQGVPTTLAALSLMEAEDHRRNVALLTYGCPTGLLYAAVFPDYFGPDQMDAFATRWMREDENSKVRWVNLWRLTDWTGGYVKAGERDRYFDWRKRFEKGEPTQRDLIALDSKSFCELRLADPDPDLIARNPFSNSPDVVLLKSDPIPGPYGHDETGYLHEREYADARKVLAQALHSS